jgi:hypothetical protein
MTRSVGVLIIGLVLATSFIAAERASGKGGPIVPGVAYGGEGVTAPGSVDRYVTLYAGARTMIARLQQDGGRVLRTRSGRGYGIPAVTVQGDADGLSADGSTLVLVPENARLGRERTTLRILHAPNLRNRDRITLDGAFTFDAISPDGSRIYLIEYPSRPDTTRYLVRALDVRSGRLDPQPILDPDETPGDMRGYPVRRAISPDGRWAYTLYGGAGEHPFIHALDTVEGRAVCIDLDEIGIYRMRRHRMRHLQMSPDGSELTVAHRKRGPVAVVDTATFEVSDPAAEASNAGFPWLLVVLGAAAGLAAWALAHTLRRRRVAAGGAR